MSCGCSPNGPAPTPPATTAQPGAPLGFFGGPSFSAMPVFPTGVTQPAPVQAFSDGSPAPLAAGVRFSPLFGVQTAVMPPAAAKALQSGAATLPRAGPQFSPMLIGGAALAGPAGQAGRQANAAPIGPLLTVTFTTTAITPTKSGTFMVWGNLAANASGVSTQAGTLLLDGVTVLDTQISGTGGAGPFDMSFLGFVTVSFAAHTFAVQATASAGTNTIPAGDAAIMFLEL